MTTEHTLERLISLADKRVEERERALGIARDHLADARALEADAADAILRADATPIAACTAAELMQRDGHRMHLVRVHRRSTDVRARAEADHDGASRALVHARVERERLAHLLTERRERAASVVRRIERRAEDEHAARSRIVRVAR